MAKGVDDHDWKSADSAFVKDLRDLETESQLRTPLSSAECNTIHCWLQSICVGVIAVQSRTTP